MEDDNPFTKSQTIDPEVRAYVFSLVNALGGTSGDEYGRYVLGDDALAVLRDLKRWLKLYDEKTNRLDVARCLAEAKVVTGDLLPIIASWKENGKENKSKTRLVLACLELLVPLTWPLEHGEMTVNHHRHTPYLQQAQVLYKAAVLTWENTHVLRQCVRVALPSIAMKREERTPRDDGIIKLMLYFLRNVAVIRQIPSLPSQGFENEISRSATIEAFRQQDVFALLLTMCSNMDEDFGLQDVVILEILFNLTKGIDVEKLWMTEAQRKTGEVSDLKATLNEEDTLHKDAKKSEWSRHGRFGTMIWIKREGDKMSAVSGQDNLRDGRTALFNIDKSKKWNKPQQRLKGTEHTIHDFDHKVQLTSSASEKLRNFAEEFLDSGFNPLFNHLRKAIEREAERVLDVNYRQFFYVVSWFLQAERVRRQKQRKEKKPANLANDFGVESFALIAAMLNQETFIMMNRYMQNALDNKEWQDLNAAMRCFTQILLTVQEMAQSSLDEDQEIAENIQNRIFYEETTHDRIVTLLRGYKDQGFGYLDACTELAHVFLRMLERYSKDNADLQIRSRRRAKKRKKELHKQARPEGEDAEEDENSENEDILDAVQVSRERKFDFKRFAAKFTTQATVDTFIKFTTQFHELTPEQHKRAHRFFYRVAFKQEMAVLLYRVDYIALFYKMIQGPEGLSRKHPMYAEWFEFTKQVFRKMFKKLDQRPEMLVEMLFSKINSTLFYLEYGYDKQTTTSTRPPAELEIKSAPGRDRIEQIGIVVSILVKDDKAGLVQWVRDVLSKAWDERHAWELEAEARHSTTTEATESNEQQAQEQPSEKPAPITVRPSNDDVRTATFKNARLKLLMKLVGFENLGEDSLDATWTIPGEVNSQTLQEFKSAIERYETTPWQSSNPEETAEDLLKRARHAAPRQTEDGEQEAIRDGFIDDSEGNDDVEDFLFPDNIRSKPKPRNMIEELKAKRRKRKRAEDDDGSGGAGELDEEEVARRRTAREQAALERRRKIKSDLFIHDSDDETDEERDRTFFQNEELNRKRQEQRVKRQMALVAEEEQGAKSKKKQKVKRNMTVEDDSDHEDTVMPDVDHEETAPSSSQTRDPSDVDIAEEEETPFSSPTSSRNDDPNADSRALKEMRQPRDATPLMNKTAQTTRIAILDDSDEEDGGPVLPVIARRTRGGFVIDSDDDDE